MGASKKPFRKRNKVNPEIVSLIRYVYAEGGISQRELARLYGLTQGHISSIIRRDSWRTT